MMMMMMMDVTDGMAEITILTNNSDHHDNY